ncbi:MAG: hypothetical protein IPK27_19865 [Rhodanobacteraceae bacterium]|nr:hypothetical protein [Rhodanobacteraceae bacterium]
MKIQKQWELVHALRAKLVSDNDKPVLESLEHLWQHLQKKQGDVIDREDKVADSPLSGLFHYIDSGFYPPPELMLSLLECWDEYLTGRGSVSLEEAFFGRPIQKAGNYAKRKSQRIRNAYARFEVERERKKGRNLTQAAEAVSLIPGMPDADTIARTLRGFRKSGK